MDFLEHGWVWDLFVWAKYPRMFGCCGANLMMTPEHPLQLCETSLRPERAVTCAVPAMLSQTILLDILSWKSPGSFLAVELLGRGIFKILIHTVVLFIMFYLYEKAAGSSLQE